MPLETAQFIHQLDPSNPAGSDRLKDGDDHLRMLKAVLQSTFPALKGAVTVDETLLNGLASQFVPTGTVALFFGSAAPTGWGICDGSSYPRADGTGTIQTPDLRGRVAVGVSDTIALGAVIGQTNKTVTSGVSGGHTPTGKLPAHSHAVDLTVTTDSAKTGATIATTDRPGLAGGGTQTGVLGGATLTDPGHTHGVHVTGTTAATADTALSLDAVDGHTHSVQVDVTQPSLGLNYIIKL